MEGTAQALARNSSKYNPPSLGLIRAVAAWESPATLIPFATIQSDFFPSHYLSYTGRPKKEMKRNENTK
jgi:hypothetical protein